MYALPRGSPAKLSVKIRPARTYCIRGIFMTRFLYILLAVYLAAVNVYAFMLVRTLKKQEERRENAFFRCGKSVSRTVLRRRAGSVPSSFLHFYILHRDGSCFPGGEMFLPVSPYWRGRAGEENGRKGKKRNSMTLQYRKSVRSQCTEGKGVFLLDPRRIL